MGRYRSVSDARLIVATDQTVSHTPFDRSLRRTEPACNRQTISAAILELSIEFRTFGNPDKSTSSADLSESAGTLQHKTGIAGNSVGWNDRCIVLPIDIHLRRLSLAPEKTAPATPNSNPTTASTSDVHRLIDRAAKTLARSCRLLLTSSRIPISRRILKCHSVHGQYHQPYAVPAPPSRTTSLPCKSNILASAEDASTHTY